jgi:hypothetical protein
MSAVTWGVCSKRRTVTVFCMDCRKVFHRHAPMIEALELKMAAQATHDCAEDWAPPIPAAVDLFGFPLEAAV